MGIYTRALAKSNKSKVKKSVSLDEVREYFAKRISNWYQNANEDYGVSGNLISISEDSSDESDKFLIIRWEEYDSREGYGDLLKTEIHYYEDYTLEQLFNIWSGDCSWEVCGDTTAKSKVKKSKDFEDYPENIKNIVVKVFKNAGLDLNITQMSEFAEKVEDMISKYGAGSEDVIIDALTTLSRCDLSKSKVKKYSSEYGDFTDRWEDENLKTAYESLDRCVGTDAEKHLAEAMEYVIPPKNLETLLFIIELAGVNHEGMDGWEVSKSKKSKVKKKSLKKKSMKKDFENPNGYVGLIYLIDKETPMMTPEFSDKSTVSEYIEDVLQSPNWKDRVQSYEIVPFDEVQSKYSRTDYVYKSKSKKSLKKSIDWRMENWFHSVGFDNAKGLEFHITEKSDGNYNVEVWKDGQLEEKEFEEESDAKEYCENYSIVAKSKKSKVKKKSMKKGYCILLEPEFGHIRCIEENFDTIEEAEAYEQSLDYPRHLFKPRIVPESEVMDIMYENALNQENNNKFKVVE